MTNAHSTTTLLYPTEALPLYTGEALALIRDTVPNIDTIGCLATWRLSVL